MMIPLLLIALQGATPAATATPQARPTQVAERSADSRDRVICKRFAETGSLVRATRICKTRAEWDRDRDNIRAPSTTGSACGMSEGGGC